MFEAKTNESNDDTMISWEIWSYNVFINSNSS